MSLERMTPQQAAAWLVRLEMTRRLRMKGLEGHLPIHYFFGTPSSTGKTAPLRYSLEAYQLSQSEIDAGISVEKSPPRCSACDSACWAMTGPADLATTCWLSHPEQGLCPFLYEGLELPPKPGEDA